MLYDQNIQHSNPIFGSQSLRYFTKFFQQQENQWNSNFLTAVSALYLVN